MPQPIVYILDLNEYDSILFAETRKTANVSGRVMILMTG